MIITRPISQQEIQYVMAEGAKDDHGIIAPTHVVVDGKELLGALSVGSIPLVLPWFNTKKCTARISGRVIRDIETSMRFAGWKFAALPLGKTSPFYPLMEQHNFVKIYENTLFMKVLNA